MYVCSASAGLVGFDGAVGVAVTVVHQILNVQLAFGTIDTP